MEGVTPDYLSLQRALAEHRVKFIVGGGVCAVLHGASFATFALEVVHSRVRKMFPGFCPRRTTWNACCRAMREQRLRPAREYLISPGRQLLIIRFGPLDILGIIGVDHDYGELLKYSVEYEVSRLHLLVLDLEALIKVEEEVGSEKDWVVLSILRRPLEENLKR